MPELIAAARALLAALPSSALVSGARLGRWESQDDDLTVADGEAGRGVYFFYAHDAETSAHYAGRHGERRLAEVRLSAPLVDLTHPKAVGPVCRWLTAYSAMMGSGFKWDRSSFQRSFWGLMTLADVIREALPDAAGYVVPHVIPSCSPSRQIVVFRDEVLLAA